MGWREAHLDAPLGQHVMVAVSIFCIAIAIVWASLKLYDEPARGWLKKKLSQCRWNGHRGASALPLWGGAGGTTVNKRNDIMLRHTPVV